MSICSGPASFLPPSSSAVSPQRSSDSVNTSFARVNAPSSLAICSTVSVRSRLIASCSGPGTGEKVAVSVISAMTISRACRLWRLVHLEEVGVRLGGIGPDGEADGLAPLVLRRPGGPGTCQVAPGSVGVARRQVRRQVAQARGFLVQHALPVLPRRHDLLLDHALSFLFSLHAGGAGVAHRIEARLEPLLAHPEGHRGGGGEGGGRRLLRGPAGLHA